jgi:hypothetical protein
VPQGRTKVSVSTAPRRPVKPNPVHLRLTYSGPPLVRSVAQIEAIIRRQCAGVLNEAELSRILPRTEGPRKPVLVAADRKGPSAKKRRL